MYSAISNKFPYLELRLFFAIIMSVIIIISDEKLNMFLKLKSYMEDSTYLFYCLCDKSHNIYNYTKKLLSGYDKLILENNTLRQELCLKNSELLLMDQYKDENYKLHALIHSPLCYDKQKIITRIISVNADLYGNQVIINQGKNHNIYIGQPVITDSGIIGQVISTNTLSSRVMLICDPEHALPVQIKRNNMRFILMGCGYGADLRAEYPGYLDVCIGDILITSGLDGRFPEGYPVATVSNIIVDSEQDSTIIQAHPTVKLQSLCYAILLWK
ncbi:rod shape-determining protein MreC [Blochmannia endosymbiont of Camponotus sp. C-003]|uniref:rod shape-determining protein MreC n=1 Tax=unclassified Candidatus Blochmanniella TaxID=711328 RepID=UPI002024D355|nr:MULTISPECIES: rod shape-determining protein MreC [unclassified Candidatus Blochmannia]URJ23514.1 rod shape-determining protein MreC [Blochmannia endosymbiont of Camponotus sp. C-003]URJ28986.1 rod shape-determining protein MreC [Blochmannia endosymbiont of Camponotus sp. C-046]